MALYMIGDVQGCDGALGRLLAQIGFSPSRDTVYLLGDLVNRGPESLAVLRRVAALGNAAHAVLGNHDLHLLAVAHGIRKPHRKDTLQAVLAASDRDTLLDDLRQRPLAIQAHGWLMVHAGVLPQWSAKLTMALAAEVSDALRGPDLVGFLRTMYGNLPDRWHDDLRGADRLRVVVNALTRLRFCTPQGVMEFDSKDGASGAPAGFLPWFEVASRQTRAERVAFGHWSTLGLLKRDGILALDTGCVWGGCLSAARLGPGGEVAEVLKVDCPQQQVPGR